MSEEMIDIQKKKLQLKKEELHIQKQYLEVQRSVSTELRQIRSVMETLKALQKSDEIYNTIYNVILCYYFYFRLLFNDFMFAYDMIAI